MSPEGQKNVERVRVSLVYHHDLFRMVKCCPSILKTDDEDGLSDKQGESVVPGKAPLDLRREDKLL